MTAVTSALGSATVPAPPRRRASSARCPYCRGPVAGLLADCDREPCRRQSIADEAALTRLEDL